MTQKKFILLVEKYRQSLLYTYSGKYGCGAEIVEDALQDIILRFLEKHTYRDRTEEHMTRLIWIGVEHRMRTNNRTEVRRLKHEREACYHDQCY